MPQQTVKENPVFETAIDEISGVIRSVIKVDQATLHEPCLGEMEMKAVSDCIKSGFVSSVGDAIFDFESALVDFTGARHVIAVVNGTAALHLALVATGVQANDEVLVPALTFVASGNAIIYAKAVPHFVDSSSEDLGIDVERLDAHLAEVSELRDGFCWNKITGNRISHIMPVHIFGHIGDMAGLREVADRYRLVIVEDAAEALGSRRDGRHAGLFGCCGALSFNGNKIITTGGGGAILTDDDELAAFLRALATTAKRPHPFEYWHDQLGYNYRLPALNAALGVAQMSRLDTMIIAKAQLARAYERAFESAKFASFFSAPPESSSNNWLNAICLNEQAVPFRDSILEGLNALGYGCRPVWKLLCDLPHFQECPKMDLATAHDLANSLINIPSSASLVQTVNEPE